MTEDPVLSLLPRTLKDRPRRIALLYSVLALSTSIAASMAEGLFITNGSIFWRGQSYPVHPLTSNFSTLLDFGILNPFIIYYVHSSRLAMQAMPGFRGRLPVRDKKTWLLKPIACMLVALAMMSVYYRGFLDGNFFDAVVTVSHEGSRLITVTGWLVFLWTALAVYYVLVGVCDQLAYALFVKSLVSRDLRYEPTHKDRVAGMRVYAEPSLYFLKFSAVVLIVFVVFTVYDYLVFDVAESNRVWCLPAYLLVVAPMVISPIMDLHTHMKAKRTELLRLAMLPAQAQGALFNQGESGEVSSVFYSNIARELDALEAVRKWILRQPTWPLPTQTLLSAGAYLSSVALPLVPKVVDVLLASFGVGAGVR